MTFLKEYPEHKGLYLHGSFGSGKSYLVTAVLVELAKTGKAPKVTKTETKTTARKVEEKSSAKVEKKEKVDYSKMTVAELKSLAKEKNISGYTTMKKAELVAALEK